MKVMKTMKIMINEIIKPNKSKREKKISKKFIFLFGFKISLFLKEKGKRKCIAIF